MRKDKAATTVRVPKSIQKKMREIAEKRGCFVERVWEEAAKLVISQHEAERLTPSLTIKDLLMLYDSVKSVLYAHPDDLEQPFVKTCRDNGYEIISRDSMIKGKALIQNISKSGVIDFKKGEAYLGRNIWTELSQREIPADKPSGWMPGKP